MNGHLAKQGFRRNISERVEGGQSMAVPTSRAPKLVDVHAHLADPAFSEDLPAVLERAARAGVRSVISMAENLEDSRQNLSLAERYPEQVLAAAGLFPTCLEPAEADAVIDFIRAEAPRLVAIGEVGLDYWKVQGAEERDLQREILARFVALSSETLLPLSVHSRSAGRHAVSLLLEQGARRVALHAFDGKPSAALAAAEAGYFFSIPPSVVRSRQKQRLVAALPLHCLLLESDSPVLGPSAEARNEPENLVVALQAIAEIKGLRPEAVAEGVEENTIRLFGKRLTGNLLPGAVEPMLHGDAVR
jgi:TatD DNase family protein